MKFPGILVALVACVALGGCGNDVDEVEWQQDVEQELGQPVSDWPAYRDVWVDTCEEDDGVFDLFVAGIMDEGTSVDVIRTNVRHACPDRLEQVEETLDGVEEVD